MSQGGYSTGSPEALDRCIEIIKAYVQHFGESKHAHATYKPGKISNSQHNMRIARRSIEKVDAVR